MTPLARGRPPVRSLMRLREVGRVMCGVLARFPLCAVALAAVIVLFAAGLPVPAAASAVGAIGMLVSVERVLGDWRALAALFQSLVPAIVIVGAFALIPGSPVDRLDVSVGPDIAFLTAGSVVIASRRMPATRRWRVNGTAALLVSVLLLYSVTIVGVVAAIAVLVGMLVGRRSRGASAPVRPSGRDVRGYLATGAMVLAVGPLVDALTGNAGVGLLTPVSAVLQSGTVLDVSLASGASGSPWRAALSALAQVLPSAALGVCALGLRGGSRFAMWMAVTVSVTTTAGVVLVFHRFLDVVPAGELAAMTLWDDLVVGAALLASVLLPLAFAFALIVCRSTFRVRVARKVLRRFLWTLATAVASVTVVSVLLSLSLQGMHTQEFRVFAFAAIVTLAVLVVLGAGLLVSIVPSGDVRRDLGRLRPLLASGRGGIFAHMGTWQGNSHWFAADGDAVVSYRVELGVAITLGQPVCAEGREAETFVAFAEFCSKNGWRPAFYGIDSDWADQFRSRGWYVSAVGDDATIDVSSWTLSGKKKQDIRTAVNRFDRERMQTVWTTWAELPAAVRAQIIAVSEQWAAGRRLPEMGFTLGGVDELLDGDVRVALALSAQGRLYAVTSWMPSYADGHLDGWTLDVMRRTGDAPNGVMEALIAAVLSRAQEDGVRWVSLSAIPLLRAAGASSALAERVADLAEPFYGFRSLMRFKRKFAPNYRPLHLAIPTIGQYPRVACALIRVYLPGLTMRDVGSVLRRRS